MSIGIMKNKLKRKVVLICISVFAVATCVTFAYQDVATKTISKEWAYLDDNYYSLVNTSSGERVLVKRLQDGDIQRINEQLVDNSVLPDTLSIETLVADSDAILPDNMLSDGSFLVENWESLQEQLINEALEIKSLESLESGEFSIGRISQIEDFSEITDIADINIRRILTANDSVVLPRDFDSSANAFEIAPSGEYVLCMSDSGMVYVDNQGMVKVISPPVYNEKTYDQLREESIRTFGDNRVFWNGQASISYDNSCVAYVSNKGDIQGTWDLYVLDIKSGNETLIKNDSEMHYGVMQWLDNDHIICSKMYDKEYDVVVVSKDGTEYSVDFSVERPVLLGAKNGMIAYGDENNDVIYIAQFTNSEVLTEIARYELDGTFRIRPGIDPFSPDGTKFAYIFVPSDNPYGRDIVVINLAKSTQESNKSIPVGTKGSSSVLEFDWLDDVTLLTSIINNETQAISSWLYYAEQK
jgi:hypothetical protein